MSAPSLSAVVVAHDSGPDLQRCLDSLRAEARAQGIEAELIVVDNASRDGAPQALRGVTLLRNERNRGYGAAANQGFRAARADRVLFLNPGEAGAPSARTTRWSGGGGRPHGGCEAAPGRSDPPGRGPPSRVDLSADAAERSARGLEEVTGGQVRRGVRAEGLAWATQSGWFSSVSSSVVTSCS